MNLYTIEDLLAIFNNCISVEDVEKVCKTFRWLICNDFQERSQELQALSILRLNQLIDENP